MFRNRTAGIVIKIHPFQGVQGLFPHPIPAQMGENDPGIRRRVPQTAARPGVQWNGGSIPTSAPAWNTTQSPSSPAALTTATVSGAST